MCAVKYPALNYLHLLREIIRRFQVVRKDFSSAEASTSSRSSIPLNPGKADPNGEADKDQLSDRVVVDHAWTGFAPRMVFMMRRGGGNDRDARNRSDDEPNQAALEEWMNSGELHRSQTPDGSTLICLNSLLAWVQKTETR